MLIYGYVKSCRHNANGTIHLQVRIPAIHGPLDQTSYKGKSVTNYTLDEDLPFYDSVLLPRDPVENDVVMLTAMNENTTHLVVIGLMGGGTI